MKKAILRSLPLPPSLYLEYVSSHLNVKAILYFVNYKFMQEVPSHLGAGTVEMP
jgi:hypothetical protein